jgi:hypothetical protein
VRRLFIGGSPFQERCPASEANDGGCPEKPDHLIDASKIRLGLDYVPSSAIIPSI